MGRSGRLVWAGALKGYRTLRHEAISAWFSVGVYTVGVVGLPVPGPRGSVEPAFPCANHGCGCHDAASCRLHCCCFGAVSDDTAGTAAGRAVVSGAALPAESGSSAPYLINATACAGLDALWVSLGVTFPVDPHAVWARSRPPLLHIVSLARLFDRTQVFLEPDVPPPQSV